MESPTFSSIMLHVPLSLVVPLVPKVLSEATLHPNYHHLWKCLSLGLLPSSKPISRTILVSLCQVACRVKCTLHNKSSLWALHNSAIQRNNSITIHRDSFETLFRRRTSKCVNSIKGQKLDTSFIGWKTWPELTWVISLNLDNSQSCLPLET